MGNIFYVTRQKVNIFLLRPADSKTYSYALPKWNSYPRFGEGYYIHLQGHTVQGHFSVNFVS